MKTGLHWVCVLLFTHIIMGCVEVDFIQRAESQSAELSCSLEQVKGRVSGLHLYHSTAHNHMTTVLSLMDATALRVSHDYRGRLEVTGGLDSSQVRVLLSPLRYMDTGRYVWEVTHTAQNSSDTELINDISDQQVILLVQGTGRRCQCSSSYPLLLYVISAAAGTLVVTLIWMTAAECARARKPHRAPPPAPIYEEMTAERQGPEASRKQQQQQQQQQGAGRPQNNPVGPEEEGPTQHLEEAVYANPTNFYACPRRLAEWL